MLCIATGHVLILLMVSVKVRGQNKNEGIALKSIRVEHLKQTYLVMLGGILCALQQSC